MRSKFSSGLLACLLLFACTKKETPKTNECDCTKLVCGTLCGNICGVCPNDGVCAADGLSCRASLDIGAACTKDLDCGLNRICLQASNNVQAPGGYCSKPCSTSVACPTGSTCAVDAQGDNVCMANCTASTTCRASEGYSCSKSVCQACVPDCTGKECGDDGCGGACNMPNASMPACTTAGDICSGHSCAPAYTEGTLTGAFPYGLFDSIALDRAGQAVVIGGRETAFYSGSPSGTRGIDKIAIYDPATHAITQTAGYTHLPVPIARPHATFMGSTLFVAGGIADPDVREGDANWEDAISSDTMAPTLHPIYKYNSTNNNWVYGAEIPNPSIGGGLAAATDVLYVVVGQTADGQVSAKFDEYDPAANEWNNPIPPPDRPTARSFAAVITDGNRIYVIGGYDGTQAVSTVEIFDPSRGWSTSTPLPFPVADPKVGIASGRIFVFGGRFSPALHDDIVPYVQSIDLKTHATHVLGQTFNGWVGQAPVGLRTAFLLFGAQVYDAAMGFQINKDVVTFAVPAP
jgi:hypothetical protein